MSALERIKEAGRALFGAPKPLPPIGKFFEAIDKTTGHLEHMATRSELDDVRTRFGALATRADLGKLLVRVETLERRLWGKSDTTTLYCSFCGKSQHEVAKLIAGPTVFICNECVALCTDIVDEETARR